MNSFCFVFCRFFCLSFAMIKHTDTEARVQILALTTQQLYHLE